jgi:hypothetical protein
MSMAVFPLFGFLKSCRYGDCTGISFIDSTTLKVCNNRRISSHKVFKDSASRGKSSMGWFYGFKLHLVVNEYGEILSFQFSKGNLDDRNIDVIKSLTKNLNGKLFGDRGYISDKLIKMLYLDGIHLITKLRKNMKNKLMLVMDKILLRKRAIIESINDILKNCCQIEHTRHRSPINFLANLLAGLIAYTYREKKPSLFTNMQKVNKIACVNL